MTGPLSRVSGVLMAGPLAPFAGVYELELKERGYTPLTSVNMRRQMARLSGWLTVSGLTVADLTSDRVVEFLAFQRDEGNYRSQRSRPGLLLLLKVLRRSGVLAADEPVVVVSPTGVLLAAFEKHLLTERGLAVGTARGYVRHADRFVSGLRSGAGLDGLTAGDVTGAVLRESGRQQSVSAAQFFIAGLRSFLRFCFIEGLVRVDLSQAALALTGRRRSSLPRGISRPDAQALLDGCDRRSVIGRRDYAVVIILLRLGLRAGEVAGLTLDDIDWRAGEVVVHGKGTRQDRLPLPVDVGEAIAGYLRDGRPVSDQRAVFLRGRAPFDPIAARTVSSTVRRGCRRAGIDEVGSHRLRHTVACDMVAAGVPLVEIAQVLRHHSLQSTAIYARVDIEQLRQLAAPWPSGVPQ